jgi:hypothetical protein
MVSLYRLPSHLIALLMFLYSCRCAAAQNAGELTIISPPPSSAGGSRITYNTAQNVHFSWTSTWPEISLQIWQIPLDGKSQKVHLDLLS